MRSRKNLKTCDYNSIPQRWLPITDNVTMSDSSQLHDFNLALTYTAGNRQLARELFVLLQQGLPTQQQAITEYYQAGDHLALFRVVHQLFTSALFCGLPTLYATVQQLEQQLQRGTQPPEPATVAQLLTLMTQIAQLPPPPFSD